MVCGLPHPIQPRPQSIPALSASNLCSAPVLPRASEILCLSSPPHLPLPRMGFVTGRRGDGCFLQPGLRGRGHGAAFGNRGGGLLGEIAALGNRDDAPARGRPLPLPAQGTPSPMHPGKCSPRTPAQAGSWSSQATSPSIPRARRRRPRAEAGVGGTCGSPAEQREPRRGTACQRPAFSWCPGRPARAP